MTSLFMRIFGLSKSIRKLLPRNQSIWLICFTLNLTSTQFFTHSTRSQCCSMISVLKIYGQHFDYDLLTPLDIALHMVLTVIITNAIETFTIDFIVPLFIEERHTMAKPVYHIQFTLSFAQIEWINQWWIRKIWFIDVSRDWVMWVAFNDVFIHNHLSITYRHFRCPMKRWRTFDSANFVKAVNMKPTYCVLSMPISAIGMDVGKSYGPWK